MKPAKIIAIILAAVIAAAAAIAFVMVVPAKTARWLRSYYRIIERSDKHSFFDDELMKSRMDNYDSDIITDSGDAVRIAQVYISSFYDEPVWYHTEYYVYFDPEEYAYYINAKGLMLHADVYIVLSKKDGRVINILHFTSNFYREDGVYGHL